MKQSQHGFTVVHGLLVLILIGIVGFTGWYVWQANENVDANLADNNSSVVEGNDNGKGRGADTPVEESARWYKYSPNNGIYSLKIADGLVFYDGEDEGPYYGIYTRDLTTAKAGVQGKVVPAEGGSDNIYGLFVNYYANAAASTHQGSLQASFETASGHDVQKYFYTETTRKMDIGLIKGDKEYTYKVLKGDSALVFTYSIAAGDTDRSALVEKMVKTVNL